MTNRFEETPLVPTNSNEKTVAASRVRMNELVMPNDTNPLGNLMGGRLLQWMDVCSAISAQRHCNRNVVTVSVDNVEFKSGIALGEVVVIEAEVTRAFTSSMEVAMRVWAENLRTGERRLCTTSFYTFVSVDADGRFRLLKSSRKVILKKSVTIRLKNGANCGLKFQSKTSRPSVRVSRFY